MAMSTNQLEECAMVFLPTMEQLRLNIKDICAVGKQASELFAHLHSQIMSSVQRAPFNIREQDFDIDEFSLVDTNLAVI